MMSRTLERHFGANWRTTLTGAGTAVLALIAFLAGLNDQLGDLAGFIPAEWRTRIAVTSAFSAALLKFLNGYVGKDAHVTGGKIRQDAAIFPRLAGERPDDLP